MFFGRRRKIKTTTKKKSTKTYTVDGCTYNSKALSDYHKELKQYVKSGLIKSFKLPEVEEAKARSKFHAYKAVINDIKFDSLNESRFYLKVLEDQKRGEVTSFELQKPYVIVPSYKKNGKTVRKMEYRADFVLHKKDGQEVVIDVKGVETDVFKLKKKLVEYLYKDVTILCVRYIAAEKKWMTLKEYDIYKKAKKKAKAKAA